ncbi:DUF2721 domain-containing protein [Qipengyuania sp.]|uniref:DUF2721 domain-containing protein n=1 Tax=Qipengyuania sp. TaxID=2004515 RepID=UPI00373608F3
MPELLVAMALDFDLIERTSSTLRVQNVVQLSLAPAFLLAAIGAVMNVMTNRLIWVAERIDRIRLAREAGEADEDGELVGDLPALEKRRVFAQRAVMLSTAAALTISIVIMLLFVSAFVTFPLGTLVASMWMLTMLFLVGGLGSFVMETRTAARRNGQRLRMRRGR